MSFDKLINQVSEWADDRELLKKENSNRQMLKVIEEIGELAGALARGNEAGIVDGLGDAFVTLIILSKQRGYSPEECLQAAYDEIKNRKGKTQNGVFIKETE